MIKGFEKFRSTKKGQTRFEELKEMHDKLPVGSEHAVKKEYVASLWHLKNTRVARKIMTEEMVKAGLPVCNLGGGYFVPRNSIEMEGYYNWYHSYYKSAAQGFYYRKKMLDGMKDEERRNGLILSPLAQPTGKHKRKRAGQRRTAAVGL